MNRKIAVIVVAGALVGILVGVALAGGDDGSQRRPVPPDLGVPDTTGLPPAETGPSGPTDATPPEPDTGGSGGGTGNAGGGSDTGGTQAPSGGQDTETNDTPPPKGSPAERFE